MKTPNKNYVSNFGRSLTFGLILFFSAASSWAQDFQGGLPPGGGNMPSMTSEQKALMDSMRQHPELQSETRSIIDAAGGPGKAMNDPEVAKKIRALVEKNKNASVSAAAAKPDLSNSPEVKDLIVDLKSIKGKENEYVRINGKIPTACQEKLQLELSCDSKNNTVLFNLREVSQDGFSCLRENKIDCATEDSKNCKTFEALSAIAGKKYSSRLVKESSNNCDGIQIESVKVGVSSKVYAPLKVDSRSKTEGTFCEACEAASQSHQLGQIKQGAIDIEKKIEQRPEQKADQRPRSADSPRNFQGPPPAASSLSSEVTSSSSVGSEEMKKHLEREKDRMITKIKSAACPSAGGDDEDMDPSDMMAGMAADGPPSGGRGGGGKPGGGSDMAGGMGGDMKKMFAGNLEYMDDIQDAIDAKQVKCEKEAKKKMKSANAMANSQQQMGGMNSMMGGQQQQMGGMGGMSNMSGMSSMMGNYGLGGMGSMNGMSSMMGGYGMMNGMMGGMSSMGGMGSMNPMTMSSMNPMSSMMSGYGRIGNMYTPYLGMSTSAYSSPMYLQMMQGYGLGGSTGSYVNPLFGR